MHLKRYLSCPFTNYKILRAWVFLFLYSLFLQNCDQDQQLFRQVKSKRSDLNFRNEITINDSINGTIFEYVYNGGGVAVGDVNNDGLKDLFFAGNQVTSRLYLNKGNLSFEDVTEKSGTKTSKWCTGVSFVDINEDQLLDIYICVAGPLKGTERTNIFFINEGPDDAGIPRFTDRSAEMGVNDDGYSTMGVFLDYDKDRDLDLYILTNAMEMSMRNALRPIRVKGEAPSTDRLYRNEGNEKFINVSKEAGILKEGYGLGIALCDINQDGWTDIYCSNDFISNDLLWINNKDGTFSDKAAEYFKHFTNSGMGMDISDFNNDGLLDVLVLDMLPFTNLRQKQMIGFKNLNKFYLGQKLGYLPQFIRNTLQLNRGKFEDGQYRFSEIAYMAGIYQTDWSWAPLFADYDNDGWKDLIITNGFRKDVTNLDFIVYTLMDQNRFGTEEAKMKQAISEMDKLPDVKLPNFGFKNNTDLTFSDKSKEWGFKQATFTNGTLFSDLDADGDLDLVLNNIDMPAQIYENLTSEQSPMKSLIIKFYGEVSYVDRIGVKIWAFTNGNGQFYEYSPYRGYKSSVDTDIHIGTGEASILDSLLIQWPDGSYQRILKIKTGSTLTIRKTDAKQTARIPLFQELGNSYDYLKFRDITKESNLILKDEETSIVDITHISTLIHNLSQYGPGISVADINGDLLDDIYIGGDEGRPGVFFIQRPDNRFDKVKFELDSIYEDIGALFFDADNDGDNDLYIVSGGSGSRNNRSYQDRFYQNNGTGNFDKTTDVLPEITSSGSCVVAADYDRDGDFDLFVGGRLKPWEYPLSPKSYLLENQDGKFIDATFQLGSSEGKIGMVTSALWTDINNDNLVDLMVTGEWMPIIVFQNTGQGFTDVSARYGLENSEGWWNSLNGCDLDNDGDIDYLAGNYGLNSFFKASVEKPVEIYAADFDQDGSIDPVITHYIDNDSYIIHPRNILNRKIPGFENRIKTFEQYGTTPFRKAFTSKELEEAIHLNCTIMESVILENLDGGKFKIHYLPNEIQISPVYGVEFHDFNGDHLTDIMLVGNSYAEETITGYYDASYGNVLINRGDFTWDVPRLNAVNLIADGDKKALAKIKMTDGYAFIISENNGPLQGLYFNQENNGYDIPIGKSDWYMIMKIDENITKKVEFYYGNGYLSQNSRHLITNTAFQDIKIANYTGDLREFLK